MLRHFTPFRVVLLYVLLASLWFIGDAIPDTLTNVTVVAFFSAIILFLSFKSWRITVKLAESQHRPLSNKRLLLLFAILISVAPLIGSVISIVYSSKLETEAYANLEAIAELKTGQIENWLNERLGNSEMLISSPVFLKDVQKFEQERSITLRDAIEQRFRTINKVYAYHREWLVDAQGQVLFGTENRGDLPPDLSELLTLGFSSKQAVLGQLYTDADNVTYLSWAAPVFNGDEAIAAVLFQVSAGHFLFPLIQTWPTSSQSAETLLVRKDGDSVLFLNTLRHRSDTASKLYLPLSSSALPAAIAVQAGKQGFAKGFDYRNVEVLSAFRPIKNTDWFLIAKVDRDEIMLPLHRLIFWVTSIAFVAVTVISILLLMFWRQQQHMQRLAFIAQKAEAESELNVVNISLQMTRNLNQALIDSALDGIISVDRNGRVVAWNPQASVIFGYPAEQALGCDISELIVPPRFRQAHREGIVRYIETGAQKIINSRVEVSAMRSDGSEFPLELSVSAIQLPSDNQVFNAYVRDISERIQAEKELRIAATAFESHEAMMITDAEQHILKVNQAFVKITGFSAEDAIGKTPAILKSGKQDKAFYWAMWAEIERNKFWQGEIWNRRKNGEFYPEWLSISAVVDENGHVCNYVASFSDISRLKESEQIIHDLAFHDSLTKLPNRRLLIERLQRALNASSRHFTHGAILFIDLDNFKELNDVKGHELGDCLLVEVAKRLQLCSRSNDTVACLGGDDFVVVLEDLSNDPVKAATEAESIAEKIRFVIDQPFKLQDLEYHNSASIGISLFRGSSGSTVDDLLKHADTAMYQAKQFGRNTIRFFDPATHAALATRIELQAELRTALQNNQFRLYYQMQVDDTGRVLGAEALIRWLHPERGEVPPFQFIPLAEKSGLIIEIGQWVLTEACAQIKRWQQEDHTRHLQLAVNVSAMQFRQKDFVDQVSRTLRKYGVEPLRLKLELTETLVIEDVNATISKIETLKQAGINFSIDDFGTGYSSLAYLSKLPLDQLKIDRSFVSNIGINHSDTVIVQTIIGMAKNLHLEVIAEGVENEQQREFLACNGCSLYQGYLFSKPLPIEEFEQLLRNK